MKSLSLEDSWGILPSKPVVDPINKNDLLYNTNTRGLDQDCFVLSKDPNLGAKTQANCHTCVAPHYIHNEPLMRRHSAIGLFRLFLQSGLTMWATVMDQVYILQPTLKA